MISLTGTTLAVAGLAIATTFYYFYQRKKSPPGAQNGVL